MLGNHSATLAVLLTLGAATLAHAQQSAGDSTNSQRARARDERAVTTDTIRLHWDIAVRDSARAVLDQDRRQQQADEKQSTRCRPCSRATGRPSRATPPRSSGTSRW